MTVATSFHPDYQRYKYDWKVCRDAYEGEIWVKSLNECYLPPAAGMAKWQSEDKAKAKYCAYRDRAEFPAKMSNMARVALGILWGKEATIRLTPRLEYLRNRATYDGQTLQDFMAEINLEQLVVGRCGFMFDMLTMDPPMVGLPEPYLCLYKTERIVNWDEGPRLASGYRKLNLVVLDETEEVRFAGFERRCIIKHRVLSLGSVSNPSSYGNYKYGQFVSGDFDEEQMKTPTLLSKQFDFIPFWFVNTENTKPCAGPPPYVELALKSFSLYRNSADHEQQLHEQAQETLVVEGGDANTEYLLGAGAALTPEPGNKAYFIGLMGQGLAEMRAAIANKSNDADRLGGQMIDTRSLQRESGESLKTRLASQTATLSSVAETCGEALTKALREMASILGDNPEDVLVKPNTNFINPELFAKTLVELMQGKNMGFPITFQDLHKMAVERGVSELEFTEAMKILKQEPTMILATGSPTSNPSGNDPKLIESKVKSAANPTGLSPRGNTRSPNPK